MKPKPSVPLLAVLDSRNSTRSFITNIFRLFVPEFSEIYGSTVTGVFRISPESRPEYRNGIRRLEAVILCLVGAQLELLLPDVEIRHESSAVAGDPLKQYGNFHVGDSCFYVTLYPTPSLLEKCAENLAQGFCPVIITTEYGAVAAEILGRVLEVQDRVEVLEITSFLTANVFERIRFNSANRRSSLELLLERYNAIIEKCETDPSLMIELV